MKPLYQSAETNQLWLPLTCFLLGFRARGQALGAFSTLPGLCQLVFLFIGAFAGLFKLITFRVPEWTFPFMSTICVNSFRFIDLTHFNAGQHSKSDSVDQPVASITVNTINAGGMKLPRWDAALECWISIDQYAGNTIVSHFNDLRAEAWWKIERHELDYIAKRPSACRRLDGLLLDKSDKDHIPLDIYCVNMLHEMPKDGIVTNWEAKDTKFLSEQ